MASLDKLAIRGIRSFDDKQISVIEFFNPVTVIVGHNGSGKTTIIECLKYATTGDQPPNTRGGAFIHDPKMANEKEVKAQVKLRFNAANGTKMLAVRNLSVTVKKTSGLTMKTLESILALADGNAEKGGKRGVISTKCAEMDSEIPQLLGVSKSVLENVIFCHQEDSYWPLAEPAALKKKFDDIFEATRYTKALDSIKTLRKDRTAEYKVDKERLESLSREKARADQTKERISNLTATISWKQIEKDELQDQYKKVHQANRELDAMADKFRKIFNEIETQEKQKARLTEELTEIKRTVKELHDPLEKLEQIRDNYENDILDKKEKLRKETQKKEALEDKLEVRRREYAQAVTEKGRQEAEAQAQQQRISVREQLIRETAEKLAIKGFSASPLEADKIIQFITKMTELKGKKKRECQDIQAEIKNKTDEYNTKLQEFTGQSEKLKATKGALRSRLDERQQNITGTERSLEQLAGTSHQLQSLQRSMDDRQSRISSLRAEIQAEKYDDNIRSKTTQIQQLEAQKDELNSEFKSLTGKADARARLDLHRTNVKAKEAETKQTLQSINRKLQEMNLKEVTAENLEREVNRLAHNKEEQVSSLEQQAATTNASVQQAEGLLTNLHSERKSKAAELRAVQEELREGLNGEESLQKAITVAQDEIKYRQELGGNVAGASQVYESLLNAGKRSKTCSVCQRHMNDSELRVFETYLQKMMNNASPGKIQEAKQDLEDWQSELDGLQKLLPVESTIHRLQQELPVLDGKISDQRLAVDQAAMAAEKAREQVETTREELKQVQHVKLQAQTITRLRIEIAGIQADIETLEEDLSATGTTRTVGDVEEEIRNISGQIRALERERQGLTTEKENQVDRLRKLEDQLHEMELNKRELEGRIREQTTMESQIATWRREMADFSSQLKDIDSRILSAQSPINALQAEYQEEQSRLSTVLDAAQHEYQSLNESYDELNRKNTDIERYVTRRGPQRLADSIEMVQNCEQEIADLNAQVEKMRESMQSIDREITEGGSRQANIRDNIRARKIVAEIQEIQELINSAPLEEAYTASRNYEVKFEAGRAEEDRLNNAVSHLTGELSSYAAQLKTLESDLKEFGEIYKRYTDQLIKVKMSDMANNDLDKYAKALDNAIMKYHTLKMEEVNDTMRHLWNKTYQGTDIDGIKIRSDVEGGASKRSYNYRVVMTKDQVEMDMRGRCSAGQKMLASIIIRLALSDSFGQNCGILALDEPTNALDTENIDALAASLVDIINERKHHSNFQLIIITHDENFLRKLGQSDVMEHYWRVSRDPRQKSIIERQRFR